MEIRTTNPRVSVLVTSYNYAHYITQALDSIFIQKGVDFEVVLVDNGSTDDTLERIEPYRADPRLRVFVNETNLGVTGNHNRAFEHSRGDYVVWLSADDRFLPGHLARSLAWYEEHPEIDVFYTDTLVAFSDGAVYDARSAPGHPNFAYTGGRPEFPDLITRGCYMCWPTMLFRRDLIEECGPMDNAFTGSDYEYVIRLAAAGKTFGFRPTPSCIIRFHDAQQTGTAWHVAGNNVRELLQVIEKNLTPITARGLRGRRGEVAAWLTGAASQLPSAAALCERLIALTRGPKAEPIDRVTVLVLFEGRMGLLKRTLDSIKAQTFTNYDVVIASPLGYDISDYVCMTLGHGRVQVFSDPVTPLRTTHRRRAMELAGGDAIAYVHEGNTFEPDHLKSAVEQLRAGFSISIATANARSETATGGSLTSTSDPRIDENVYNDSSRPLGIADDIPLDALVHRRECWDYVDLIRPQSGPLAEWEYVLRLIMSGGAGWTGKRTLDILSIRQIIVGMHEDFKTWYVKLLSQYYESLDVNAEHALLRERHFERLTNLFAGPKPDARDFEALEAWRRELSGAMLYHVPASSSR